MKFCDGVGKGDDSLREDFTKALGESGPELSPSESWAGFGKGGSITGKTFKKAERCSRARK